MNTENNPTTPQPDMSQSLVPQVMAELDRLTAHVPIEHTMAELLAVVERLTFSEIMGNQRRSPSASVVDGLLRQDISREVIEFSLWMTEHNMLQFLTGQGGRWFLSYCNTYYSQVKQVLFITAVELSHGKRTGVLDQLRTLYPAPARIVFQIAPSILAGCIIDDGTKRTDYSLRRTMANDITNYVSRHYERPTAAKHVAAHGGSQQNHQSFLEQYGSLTIEELEARFSGRRRG